jgi:hypothetical protein
MTDVPQECIEIDNDPGLGDFIQPNSDEQLPLLESDGQTQNGNFSTSVASTYLERAKGAYGRLGAPRKFITFAAGILMRRDSLENPRFDTLGREKAILGELAACVDAALTELIVNIALEIDQVAALAFEIRSLAPDVFDRWVNLQFTVGKQLSMLTTRRNRLDPSSEQLIEEQLQQGKLAAGAVLNAPAQFENFVGIARLTLEADLNVKTINEQMELDLALNDFITARRVSFMAQSLISPSGPKAKDLAEGMKLLLQARTFDKNYQVTIDRMRARNSRRSKTVQVAADKRVTVAATPRGEGPVHGTAGTERPVLRIAV